MTIEELSNILLSNTYTLTDLSRRLNLIREYLEKKFFSDAAFTLKYFLEQSNAQKTDKKALLEYPPSFYEIFNKENAYKLLKDLAGSFEKYPVVVVYAPVDISPDEKDKIGRWFRRNFAENTFLDIQIDNKLIGGCSFVLNDIYYNFSLNYYINKYRSDIKDIINSYANAQKKSRA